MGRNITILGMGMSATRKADALPQFLDGEVWSLNNAYLTYGADWQNFDRWYELHSYDYLKEWNAGMTHNGPINHFGVLAEWGKPVFVNEPLPLLGNQIRFPLEEILETFPGALAHGSPSWMLAHALWEHMNGDKIDKITTWGIDTRDVSHQYQRVSWEGWCSRADMLGIELAGTSIAHRFDPDQDVGLAGILEKGRMIVQQHKE
jgi:hypothetical protein